MEEAPSMIMNSMTSYTCEHINVYMFVDGQKKSGRYTPNYLIAFTNSKGVGFQRRALKKLSEKKI